MVQILKQLDLLRQLAESGAVDATTKLTIGKLLEDKIQKNELAGDLTEFETKYQMSSDLFFKKFNKGELGDAMDFIEWAGLYQMFKRIESRKEMLEQGM